jgi:hypothetical protein
MRSSELPRECPKVFPGWSFHGEDLGPVSWLTRQNPRINSPAIAQDNVTDAVNAFKCPYPVDRTPFRLREITAIKALSPTLSKGMDI